MIDSFCSKRKENRQEIRITQSGTLLHFQISVNEKKYSNKSITNHFLQILQIFLTFSFYTCICQSLTLLLQTLDWCIA